MSCGVLAGAHSAVRGMGAIANIIVDQHATLSCPMLVLFVDVLEILVGVPVSIRSAMIVALLVRALTRHGRGRVQQRKTLLQRASFYAFSVHAVVFLHG